MVSFPEDSLYISGLELVLSSICNHHHKGTLTSTTTDLAKGLISTTTPSLNDKEVQKVASAKLNQDIELLKNIPEVLSGNAYSFIATQSCQPEQVVPMKGVMEEAVQVELTNGNTTTVSSGDRLETTGMEGMIQGSGVPEWSGGPDERDMTPGGFDQAINAAVAAVTPDTMVGQPGAVRK